LTCLSVRVILHGGLPNVPGIAMGSTGINYDRANSKSLYGSGLLRFDVALALYWCSVHKNSR